MVRYRSPGASGAADTGLVTRTLSDSAVARSQGTATYMTLSAGCWAAPEGARCALTANVFLELYGSRVTITDTTAPALGALTANRACSRPGTRRATSP